MKEKPKITQDLYKVLQIDNTGGLREKINKLAANPYFSILLSNLNEVFTEITVGDVISINKMEKGPEGFYLANIEFDYTILVQFERSPNEPELEKIEKSILFELSSSEEFIEDAKKNEK